MSLFIPAVAVFDIVKSLFLEHGLDKVQYVKNMVLFRPA